MIPTTSTVTPVTPAGFYATSESASTHTDRPVNWDALSVVLSLATGEGLICSRRHLDQVRNYVGDYQAVAQCEARIRKIEGGLSLWSGVKPAWYVSKSEQTLVIETNL